MSIPSPLKQYHFQAILIWWHSPFEDVSLGLLVHKWKPFRICCDFPQGTLKFAAHSARILISALKKLLLFLVNLRSLCSPNLVFGSILITMHSPNTRSASVHDVAPDCKVCGGRENGGNILYNETTPTWRNCQWDCTPQFDFAQPGLALCPTVCISAKSNNQRVIIPVLGGVAVK
jgi:hypothetical protein